MKTIFRILHFRFYLRNCITLMKNCKTMKTITLQRIFRVLPFIVVLQFGFFSKTKAGEYNFCQTDSLADCQAAYEGTWRYEDKKNKTVFILKIKSLYWFKNAFENDVYEFYGTYYLEKNGVVIEDNLNNINYLLEYSRVDDISWKELRKSGVIYPPLNGSVIFSQYNDWGEFNFKDRTTSKKPQKRIYIRVDKLDSSNNHLYWDLNDLAEYNYDCIISDVENARTEAQQANKAYAVPVKCTLTRVSHDPAYGL